MLTAILFLYLGGMIGFGSQEIIHFDKSHKIEMPFEVAVIAARTVFWVPTVTIELILK